jgi:hypothetical protein
MQHYPRDPKLPPYWLIKAIDAFRTLLLRLNRALFPANVVLYEQFQSFWLLPSLYVAAKLDIASVLKDGPLAVAEIAGRLKADSDNLGRLLRALASQGIFRQVGDGRYTLNARSRALLDGPGSLKYMILHHLGPVNWNLMSNLDYAVRTGKDPFANLYGKEIYDYLPGNPEEYELFDRSMSNLSELGLAPILNACDFSRFRVIADIGGGEGYLLANILARNPGSAGILFDTPTALERSPAMLDRFNVANRTTIVPGDFFLSVPPSADLYILKNIIHNWNDHKASELLGNIRKVMKDTSRLVIVEMVVPGGNTPSLSKLLDIQMMATMTGGKERTEGEFRQLLDKSGLSLTRIIPTLAPLSLIEARITG